MSRKVFKPIKRIKEMRTEQNPEYGEEHYYYQNSSGNVDDQCTCDFHEGQEIISSSSKVKEEKKYLSSKGRDTRYKNTNYKSSVVTSQQPKVVSKTFKTEKRFTNIAGSGGGIQSDGVGYYQSSNQNVVSDSYQIDEEKKVCEICQSPVKSMGGSARKTTQVISQSNVIPVYSLSEEKKIVNATVVNNGKNLNSTRPILRSGGKVVTRSQQINQLGSLVESVHEHGPEDYCVCSEENISVINENVHESCQRKIEELELIISQKDEELRRTLALLEEEKRLRMENSAYLEEQKRLYEETLVELENQRRLNQECTCQIDQFAQKKLNFDDLTEQSLLAFGLIAPEKIREPYRIQGRDSIELIGEMKEPLKLQCQKPDNMEILRSPKEPIRLSVQPRDNIEILSEPLEPLILKQQNPDTFEIPKTKFEPVLSVQPRDNIEILPPPIEPLYLHKQKPDEFSIEKVPPQPVQLSEQSRPGFSIIAPPKPELKMQQRDSIELISLPMEPLTLNDQHLENFTVLRAPKQPPTLETQPRDSIQILPIPREIPLKAAQMDRFAIDRLERPENVPDCKDSIEILPTPKPPLEEDYLDEIHLGPYKEIPPNLEIDPLESIQVLKTPRPENIVEFRDTMEILPEPKEPLQEENLDRFVIEKMERPEDEIVPLDGIEILKAPRPENIQEPRDSIEILPEPRKIPLVGQREDNFTIEPKIQYPPEEEPVDSFELLAKPKAPLDIQPRDKIQINPIPEEPIYLKCQKEDDFQLKNKPKPPTDKQVLDSFEILRKPRPLNNVQPRDAIEILPKPMEPIYLDCENVGEINLPGEKHIWKTDEQHLDSFDFFPKVKPENQVQSRDSIEIVPEPLEPLILTCQKEDEFSIDRKEHAPNVEQSLVGFEILKAKKPDNVVQFNDNINIIPEPLEPIKLHCAPADDFQIDKKPKLPNEIQFGDNMNIIAEPEEPIKLHCAPADDFQIDKKPKLPNEIQFGDNMNIIAEPEEPIKLHCAPADDFQIDKKPKLPNEIQFGDNMNIIAEPVEPIKLHCAPADDFEIDKKPKLPNKIQFGDNMNILAVPAEPVKLHCSPADDFEIDKKAKLPNAIQFGDNMNILAVPAEPVKLHCSPADDFEIDKKEKLPNKIQFGDNMNIIAVPTQPVKLNCAPADNFEIYKREKLPNTIQFGDNMNIIAAQPEPLKLHYQPADDFSIKESQQKKVLKSTAIKKSVPTKDAYIERHEFICNKATEEPKVYIAQSKKVTTTQKSDATCPHGYIATTTTQNQGLKSTKKTTNLTETTRTPRFAGVSSSVYTFGNQDRVCPVCSGSFRGSSSEHVCGGNYNNLKGSKGKSGLVTTMKSSDVINLINTGDRLCSKCNGTYRGSSSEHVCGNNFNNNLKGAPTSSVLRTTGGKSGLVSTIKSSDVINLINTGDRLCSHCSGTFRGSSKEHVCPILTGDRVCTNCNGTFRGSSSEHVCGNGAHILNRSSNLRATGGNRSSNVMNSMTSGGDRICSNCHGTFRGASKEHVCSVCPNHQSKNVVISSSQNTTSDKPMVKKIYKKSRKTVQKP